MTTPRHLDQPSPFSDYAGLHDDDADTSASTTVPMNRHLLLRNTATRFAGNATHHGTNEVRTSKYTWWNFAPWFLFESFTKTANIYFLAVSIFQMIPSISPTGGVPTQLVPLVAVVVVDGIFAAVEDRARHVADKRANATPAQVYDHKLKRFKEAQWHDLRVGDFIKIANHETVPADLLVLATVSQTPGVCYVETKSLDGESNLKPREAPQATRRMFDDESIAGDVVSGYVKTEAPNGDVHQFAGALYITKSDGAKPEIVPLSIKNVLLRDSKLRNADAVYALVLQTGTNCKVLRGVATDVFPVKVSSLDAIVNRQVLVVVVLLAVLCVFGAIADNSTLADLTFLSPIVAPDSVDKTVIETLAYYFTILVDLVPITLYVSITGVRGLQSYFMARDLTMYDDESDTPLTVMSMELNEQLGQITHVFADKTGTLTRNEMELRKCSIRGQVYEDLQGLDGLHANELEVFKHAALCHSVLIEQHPTRPSQIAHRDQKRDSNHASESVIEYSASSPDEYALVVGADHHGRVTFVHRDPETLAIRLPDGSVEEYDLLEEFGFTSTRKRMTVVVRRRCPDRERDASVLVLTKGSDSVVFQRLVTTDSTEELRIQDTTRAHLKAFAVDGLRTLVFATKTLPLNEWTAFHARYRRAKADLRQLDAKSKGLPNGIDTLEDKMECGLTLIGATAIEDQLQEGVPDAIAKLRAAGVAVWMLTGDMLETAINIGLSCHLLVDGMQRHVIRVTGDDTDDRDSILRELDAVFHSILDKQSNGEDHALVIDGASLNHVLGDEDGPHANDHRIRLLRVAVLCRTVIACRVSPQQKAQLVELVKHNVPHAHTLAIGDGANDVPMLRTAHVGVGIAGQEGRQAVNSADYAFAQFRFLLPLLLVHGRWNYNRVAGLVGYTFYKNIVYSLSLYWFCLNASSFSGAMMYSPLIQQFYNLLFTVLPIVVYAVQDRDLLPKDVVLKYPALYHPDARRSSAFTQRTFWTWVGLAFVDSVALFFVILAAAYGAMRYGEAVELTVIWSLGWTVMVSLVTARFCLMVHSWTVLQVLSVVFSLAAMLGVQILFDSFTWSGEDFNTYSFPWLLSRAELWLGVALAVVAILVKDVFYSVYRRRFHPEFLDLVHERQQQQRVTGKQPQVDVESQRNVLEADESEDLETLVVPRPALKQQLKPEWMELPVFR